MDFELLALDSFLLIGLGVFQHIKYASKIKSSSTLATAKSKEGSTKEIYRFATTIKRLVRRGLRMTMLSLGSKRRFKVKNF
jgi:hypothetical protein